MYFLVLAHPDCPGQSPESHKMVVVVVVVKNYYLLNLYVALQFWLTPVEFYQILWCKKLQSPQASSVCCCLVIGPIILPLS